MPRPRPDERARLLVTLLPLLGWVAGCGGGERAGGARVPLLPDPASPADESPSNLPFEVEVLVEATELDGPRSEAVNRFLDGWVPVAVGGREGFLASPEGASFQVIVLRAGDRRLVLDLVDDGRLSRLAHVDVRIDGGPPRRVPVIDPLAVRLPRDLEPGRHRVEIAPQRPDDPALVVAAARVQRVSSGGGRRRGSGEGRRTREGGALARDDGALLQEGPSFVDVVARPPDDLAARSVSGELCPEGLLAPADGVSLEVSGPDGEALGRWEAGGSPLDRLRGCRRFAVPIDRPAKRGDEAPGPMRVRLGAPEPGLSVRWRDLSWSGGGTASGRAGAGAATGRPPPKLVVLYVLDALRADFVGHLGGPEGVSPTIDRLAAEGFTFRAHRSNAPNTLPSIRELFTGRIYLDQRAWRTIGRHRPTLAESFREAGYHTGLFSGNYYTSERYGLARGFDHVSEEALFEGTPEVNRNAEAVHAAALEWMGSLPAGEPVFLYAQTIHPHNPFAPPASFERRFTSGIDSRIRGDTAVLRAIQKGELEPSAADRERLRGLYAASVAYNDARLERFLAALEERFDPEETLVLVTSDHGEELFDHGGVLHGYTLYEELLRIPLVAWSPGRVRPGSTGAPTDMLDLHATLLDLLEPSGADPGQGRRLDPEASAGRSLLPLLTGRTEALPHQPRYAATWGVPGGIFAVVDREWKLIRVRGTEDGWWMGVGPARTHRREHLYDLAADPGEGENLAGSGTPRGQWLRARLRAWVAEQEAAVRAAMEADGGPGESAEPALDEEA
ncbi:MAG: sulfatase, partial [Thermoanaerobaculia bacterium]